jgi:hypothetical protein
MTSLPSAATLRRSQRAKPIVSYKNTVGANAPTTTLRNSTRSWAKEGGGTIAISIQSQKIQAGVLNLLVEGDKLEVGAVGFSFWLI